MNKLTVIITTLVNKAASGDLRAILALQPLIDRMEASQAETARLSEELSVDDKEILKEYAERSKNTAQPSAL